MPEGISINLEPPLANKEAALQFSAENGLVGILRTLEQMHAAGQQSVGSQESYSPAQIAIIIGEVLDWLDEQKLASDARLNATHGGGAPSQGMALDLPSPLERPDCPINRLTRTGGLRAAVSEAFQAMLQNNHPRIGEKYLRDGDLVGTLHSLTVGPELESVTKAEPKFDLIIGSLAFQFRLDTSNPEQRRTLIGHLDHMRDLLVTMKPE